MRQPRAIIFWVAFVIVTLVIGTLPGRVMARDGRWSQPRQISGTTPSSWFPDIAVGPNNSVHIVWVSGITIPGSEHGVRDLLLYSAFVNGRWSKPNDIANPGGTTDTTRNSIVMGRDGQLHVLVRSQRRIDYIHAPWD